LPVSSSLPSSMLCTLYTPFGLRTHILLGSTPRRLVNIVRERLPLRSPLHHPPSPLLPPSAPTRRRSSKVILFYFCCILDHHYALVSLPYERQSMFFICSLLKGDFNIICPHKQTLFCDFIKYTGPIKPFVTEKAENSSEK
jgi:hypothetical protein